MDYYQGEIIVLIRISGLPDNWKCPQGVQRTSRNMFGTGANCIQHLGARLWAQVSVAGHLGHIALWIRKMDYTFSSLSLLTQTKCLTLG